MHSFGVQSPHLKAIARQPILPTLRDPIPMTFSETRSRETASWAGAKVRNIVGMGEVSAKGTPGETGVILVEVPDGSDAEKAGLFEGDVMLAVDGKRIEELHDLLKWTRKAGLRKPLSISVLRYGQESTVEIKLAP